MNNKKSKLVRDKIPEIIRTTGKEPITKLLDTKDYEKALSAKLLEEVDEFLEVHQDNKTEAQKEIADILEVIDALCLHHGYNTEEIQKYKKQKKCERGGFEKKIMLFLDKN